MFNNKNETYTIIKEAPEIEMYKAIKAGDILINFYESIGWNKIDILNPNKVCISSDLADDIHSKMITISPQYTAEIGMLYVHNGPELDDTLTGRQVKLINGWITPDANNESSNNKQ